MIITILTLFPEVFQKIFSTSIIGRAQKRGIVKFRYFNIRDYATDRYKSVDDRPYGGGVGMIMRVDVVERAISNVKCKTSSVKCNENIILLDPKGKLFNQAKARQFAKFDHLILVCGHYEGIDARITNFVDESISIGRYILTGGEIPAMAISDAIVRLLPKVLKNKQAIKDESYSTTGLIEPPQYTRPSTYKGYKVPEVLLSGNHQEIIKWRKFQSIK